MEYEHNEINPVTPEDLEGMEAVDPEAERLDEIQGTVRRSLEQALEYYHETLEPVQEEATNYYHGRPFGDEEEGRSQVVSTDLRDTTLAQLPGLLRTFFSAENPVRFRPRGPEDEELAAQQTEYVQYIVAEENPGFLTFHSVFKDALVRKIGIVKWWYDQDYRTEANRFSGLGEVEVSALIDAPETIDFAIDTATPDPATGVVLYDGSVTYQKQAGCVKFDAVPNEEFVFAPGSRSLKTSPLVAHVRMVPRGDLVALGVDEELIEESLGKAKHHIGEGLNAAREFHGSDADWTTQEDEELDESQQKVLYAEAYARIDVDDDRIGELRMFQCVGPEFKIVNGDGEGEIVDDLPFAIFCPDPEPHTVVGLGNHDLLKDIQRIKSQILRGTMNSLASAIEPQLGVVEGEVNMGDVLSPEINKVIRMTKPGMLQEIKHTFVGPDTMPVLDYMDEVKEARTGKMKGAPGVDADALQSSTKAAVSAVVVGIRERAELLARIFAETGMKDFYRGIFRLICKHQDQAKMVRLRGKYVQVDPKTWDANMDVMIDLPLGAGTTEERLQIIQGVLAMQEKLMGAGSPLVTWVEIRSTLAKGLELMGYRSADPFFRPWGPQEQQALEKQMAESPPQPDPQMLIVQIEQQKAQMQALVEQEKLRLKEREIELQDDRERDKMAREMALKEREIELKHQVEIEDAKLRAQIEKDRMAMEKREAQTTEAA